MVLWVATRARSRRRKASPGASAPLAQPPRRRARERLRAGVEIPNGPIHRPRRRPGTPTCWRALCASSTPPRRASTSIPGCASAARAPARAPRRLPGPHGRQPHRGVQGIPHPHDTARGPPKAASATTRRSPREVRALAMWMTWRRPSPHPLRRRPGRRRLRAQASLPREWSGSPPLHVEISVLDRPDRDIPRRTGTRTHAMAGRWTPTPCTPGLGPAVVSGKPSRSVARRAARGPPAGSASSRSRRPQGDGLARGATAAIRGSATWARTPPPSSPSWRRARRGERLAGRPSSTATASTWETCFAEAGYGAVAGAQRRSVSPSELLALQCDVLIPPPSKTRSPRQRRGCGPASLPRGQRPHHLGGGDRILAERACA